MDELRDRRGRWTASPSAIQGALKNNGYNPQYDKEGTAGFPDAMKSMRLQVQAQGTAQAFYDHIMNGGGDPSLAEENAANTWMAYQSPDEFSTINKTLRENKTIDDGVPVDKLKTAVSDVFDMMGYTTPAPMTVYRAIPQGGPSGIDWKSKLVPGAVYQDAGIVSTTAQPNYAQGWLDLPNSKKTQHDMLSMHGRKEKPSDIVMEIHIPAGTRVVGGTPQFIETMLKPGTKLKVTSAGPQKSSPTALNPLGSIPVGPAYTYTHVVAEVQP